MAGERSVTVRCPSKINLFLEVLGKRPDRYHDIETVMVEFPALDDLTVASREEPGVGLGVECPGHRWDLPGGDANLVSRAALAVLGEVRDPPGVRIRLTKGIPPGAGLGGGSSDAAAALRAVNDLLGRPVDAERLHALAAGLGSDVPYFLRGGCAVARGRGEALEPGPGIDAERFLLVVLYPGAAASTSEVYRRCIPASPEDRRRPDEVLYALRSGDAGALSAACFNRLERPAAEVCPAIGRAMGNLRSLGLGEPHLTGSGSACFLVRPFSPEEMSDEGVRERATDGLPGAVLMRGDPGRRPAGTVHGA